MISIIIPVYDAERTISRCLDSLCNQTVDRNEYEIILVDDGCTDATCEIAKQYPDVRVISQSNRGPAAARNRGVREARGEIVLFTDSDCEVTPDWIERMAAPFASDPDIVATKGAYRTKQKQIVARFVQLEYENKYDVMSRGKYIDFVDTYSAGFRKEVFLEADGYDEDFPLACAEDVDLSFRLANKGYKMEFVPEAIVYHIHPETLVGYLKKKFRFARWRMLAVKKNPNKIVKDSHTPQIMKLMVLLGPCVVISFVVAVVTGAYFAFVAAVLVFGLMSAPFVLKAIGKDPLVGLLSPLLLFGRSIAQFLGVCYGVLRAWGSKIPPR